MHAREEEKEKLMAERVVKVRAEMQRAKDEAARERQKRLQKQREEETRIRQELMDRMAEQEKIDQMTYVILFRDVISRAMKKKQKQLEHRKEVEIALEQRRKAKEEEERIIEDELQRNRELNELKLKLIEEERQRLIRENAKYLEGNLPKVR